MKNVLLLIVILFLDKCLNFNCRINYTDVCVNNTICSESGLCSCPLFHYGDNCDKLLKDSKYITIHSEGITFGSYIGIIIGITVSLPIILIVGLVIIYYSLKDREY